MTYKIALTNEAIRIMKLPVLERTEEKIRIAIASLIQTTPDFADFPTKIQKLIVKYCNYDQYETGRVIIRQGHRADNFYFMVSGLCKKKLFFRYFKE
jgi:CRP-like cAMP-binding protein